MRRVKNAKLSSEIANNENTYIIVSSDSNLRMVYKSCTPVRFYIANLSKTNLMQFLGHT